jgi:hypothetical protein
MTSTRRARTFFRVDARKLPPELSGKVDLVFMDPPYSTHLDYGDDPRDIGKLDVGKGRDYYDAMDKVFAEAHRAAQAGKHLGLYVSDSYVQGQRFLSDRLRAVRSAPQAIRAGRHRRGRRGTTRRWSRATTARPRKRGIFSSEGSTTVHHAKSLTTSFQPLGRTSRHLAQGGLDARATAGSGQTLIF